MRPHGATSGKVPMAIFTVAKCIALLLRAEAERMGLPDRNAQKAIVPTQREIFFDDHDIIVSKTDLKGRLTDASRMFCSSAGYPERDVIGQPHSLIRHPVMPRGVQAPVGCDPGQARDLRLREEHGAQRRS